MSSENQPTGKVDMTWVLALFIVAIMIKYSDTIEQTLKAFLIIIIVVGILGSLIYWVYRIYTRPKPIHHETGEELDLSKFGTPEWDEEPEYKWDRLNEQWVEKPEPKVQSTPTMQEKQAEPLFVLNSPKYEEDLLACPLHLAGKLTQNQITTLEHHDYLLKEFVPLGKTRRETYYIQEQKPESFEHTFVVHSIVEKLKPFVQSVEVHRTQQPDIVFYHKGDKYALEVETPHHQPHKHARLRSKAQRLTREYGVRWWFVTTRSAYAKTFAPYGSVLTRNQIDQWVQENFTPPKTPPPLNTI